MLWREPDAQLAISGLDPDHRPFTKFAGEKGATDSCLEFVGEVAP